MSDLRKNVILGHIPIQANRFYLANVKPLEQNWTIEACNWIHAHVVDQSCSIRIIENVDLGKSDTMPCNITLNGLDIGKQMILEKHANYSAVHFLDTAADILKDANDETSRSSKVGHHIESKKTKKNKAEKTVDTQDPSSSKHDITRPPMVYEEKKTKKNKPAKSEDRQESIASSSKQDITRPPMVYGEFNDDDNDEMTAMEYKEYFDIASMHKFAKDIDDIISANPDGDEDLSMLSDDELSVFKIDPATERKLACRDWNVETNEDSDATDNSDESCSMSDTVSVNNVVPNTSPFTPLRIPLGIKGFYAKTRYMESVTKLMVEPELDEMIRQMKVIKSEIEQYVRKASNIFEKKVGMPCLAKYEDGIYYRAVIKSIDAVTDDVTVVYTDYLNESVLKSELIRKCPMSLLAIPTAVAEVRLSGIKKNSRLRGLDVRNKLAEILDGERVYMRIVKYNASVPKVEIFTDPNDTIPVYQNLFDEKYLIQTKM